MNFDLDVQRPKVIWKQVAEQIRKKITKNDWPPGTKLPSTAELAAQSGADVKTIHHALTELVREGLITRTRKVGTYVSERKPTLSKIGIYHSSNIHLDPRAHYLQALHDKLQKQAAAQGIATRIWVDHRPPHLQTSCLPEMEKAAKDREIEGIISTLADPMHLAWLRKFPVPVAFLGARTPTSVAWDYASLMETALGSIRKGGARSVGLIVSMKPNATVFFDSFYGQCEALGLKTAPNWIINPAIDDDGFGESCFESFGYEGFNKLWAGKKKPEGLFVYPDSLARGVIMAMMAHQVRVPEDLRVVLHKNDEVKLFCPLHVTYAVSSVKEVANALLKQVSMVYQGKETKYEELKFKIAPEKGSEG